MSDSSAAGKYEESERLESRPFLKWAGGKTQLLQELRKRVPTSYSRYFEPFIGGGALFFDLQPKHSFLSDSNSELINAYLVVRDRVEELIQDLGTHTYEERYFYQLRERDRSGDYHSFSPVERASRFIYLNKTCFNGLYRVNSKGHFNVPFGNYSNPKIADAQNLRACSKVLAGAEIVCENYLVPEHRMQSGDFVYFDPPYAPLTATSNFTGYTQGGFGEKDQEQLRDVCRRLDAKGVSFMLSNSAAPLILELFQEFNLSYVEAARAINSKGAKRGKIQEVIVTNY